MLADIEERIARRLDSERSADQPVKILYLYRSMKFDNSDYHISRDFTTRLERRHRLHYKYAVLPSKDYDRSSRADPGYPEWLSDVAFLAGRFDCVVLDGPVFASTELPRIPLETLRQFHESGGILMLLLDPGEVDAMFREDGGRQLTEFVRAAGHAQGMPLTDGSGGIVKGYLDGSSRFRLEMHDSVLDALPRVVVEHVYPEVATLDVASPVHLGPFADRLCIGDGHIRLINSDDEVSLAPRPLVFANMTRGRGHRGSTALLTGLIWTDQIASSPGNDNLHLLENLVSFLDKLQRDNTAHPRMPMIFISYSHADEEIAGRLVSRLEQAGAEVWLDRQQMGAGESISASCAAGILKADFVVVLVTPSSVGSRWVRWELQTAQNTLTTGIRGPQVIPIVANVSHADAVQHVPLLHDISYVRLDPSGESFDTVVSAVGL